MKQQHFQLPLPELLYFVKKSCHESLHVTLNELRDITEDATLKLKSENLRIYILDFIREIQAHLNFEETLIFPSIAAGEGKNKASSIYSLIDDHHQISLSLFEIRKMSSDFPLMLDIDSKKMIFFKKLKEMDRIVHNHIQIENNILFPMVLSD
jgi:iron-sulfur cluster repair protein YtfE (RIC family)